MTFCEQHIGIHFARRHIDLRLTNSILFVGSGGQLCKGFRIAAMGIALPCLHGQEGRVNLSRYRLSLSFALLKN
jgi:hypothetical protein